MSIFNIHKQDATRNYVNYSALYQTVLLIMYDQ